MEQTTKDELNNELNIVYRYLLKKGIPKTDAEDAVQETAYKYLRFSDSIRSSKVHSWLIRVALNYYYDMCRKNKKYTLNLEENMDKNETDELPERVILENERNEEIHRLLKKLKPRYRELLLLKYESDLSYEEISKLLDMKISSIKTNLFRARKKLGKLYEEANDGR